MTPGTEAFCKIPDIMSLGSIMSVYLVDTEVETAFTFCSTQRAWEAPSVLGCAGLAKEGVGVGLLGSLCHWNSYGAQTRN